MSVSGVPENPTSIPAQPIAGREPSITRNQDVRSTISADVLPIVDLRGLELAQPTDENLFCPICHSLLISPVNLPCEHVFCGECLHDALAHQPERSKGCPSCRTPTAESLITPAPKLITRILDDVRVKCPLAPLGCPAILSRASVQDHVKHYCGLVNVRCPLENCKMKVERQFSHLTCLHQSTPCEKCSKSVMEIDRVRHRRTSCTEAHEECPHCNDPIPSSELRIHTEDCMNSIISCPASKYGCDASGKRRDVANHELSCALCKLGPFLEIQQTRLDEHERALKHLRIKNEIYEEGLTNVQETLRDSLEDSAALAQSSGMSATPPFESQAAHLLDLHEALQSEVRRISTAISDLDAKLEVSLLNQTLRANEEKLHRDAVEGHMRKQLQWLVSSKLQASQRSAVVMKQSSSVTPTQGGSSPGAVGILVDPSNPDLGMWGASSAPIRRLSDSSRSETKL